MSITALQTYLRPIEEIFLEDGVAEISVNQPGEVWVECRGDMSLRHIPEFDHNHLLALGRLVAQSTDQMVSEEKPLLSATLPGGYRIQIVFPPAAETVAMSIRKQSSLQYNLDDYEKMGAFANTIVEESIDEDMIELRRLLNARDIRAFLRQAVLRHKNIIISGGTSTGKTTFMNAVLRDIPQEERIITCEDAREINLNCIPNRLHLLASRGGQGRAKVTTQELIEACLRLRPDRIIVGELRGAEAFSFLRAINTGHPGSISTLHADSPKMAYEQLTLMVMQAGMGITREQIRDYIDSIIHVVVQLKRGKGGKRFISEILLRDEHMHIHATNPGGVV